MPLRKSEAVWEGSLKEGKGTFKTGSGSFEGRYSFGSRFEEEKGSNPEELIGAAHAGCFSMALSAELGKAGYKPERIHTTASVALGMEGGGFAITRVELRTEGSIPDIDEAEFRKFAEKAKNTCPVSKALAGTKISLEEAKLI